MLNIGFIGTGNMGYSMIKGLRNNNDKDNIIIFDIDKSKMESIEKNFSVKSAENISELVECSDIIVLAVKPFVIGKVLEDIKSMIDKKRHVIVSIAAGVTLFEMSFILGNDKKIVRLMPNTPAQVQQGMTAVTFNENVEEKDKKNIEYILSSIGKSIEVDEDLIHAYTGISGSLPAYVYMFIEAVADGGVLEGIPRDKCYEIISQTVKGAAEMVLKTKKHPGQLKDEVCSPKGTTIEAVRMLENKGFRSALIEAVKVCSEKSKKISK